MVDTSSLTVPHPVWLNFAGHDIARQEARRFARFGFEDATRSVSGRNEGDSL